MPNKLMLPVVVMIRHAQSEWNREGRFTGWADPPLTDAGRAEAMRAAEAIAEIGYSFDCVYTSCLQRARETADIVMRESGDSCIPIAADWRLNERHYGALQGEDKLAMAEVEAFEIPTGVPIVYAFSPKGEPIGWHYLNNNAAKAA